MKSIYLALFVIFLHSFSFSAPRKTLLVRVDGVTQEKLLATGVVSIDEYAPVSLLSLVRDTALVLMTPTEQQTWV